MTRSLLYLAFVFNFVLFFLLGEIVRIVFNSSVKSLLIVLVLGFGYLVNNVNKAGLLGKDDIKGKFL